MAINNYEIIRPLLDFRSEDDFYFLQVIMRKKDHADRKVNGTNNNNRAIKSYYVRSLEYLDFIMPELIGLGDLFKARVGIDLNRRSVRKVAFGCLQQVANQIVNHEYDKVYKAYPTACGKSSNESHKKWILDIDDPNFNMYGQLAGVLKKIQPVGDKVIARIPSNNGVHVISSPFNIQQFREWMPKTTLPEIEIHKRNPTNLYIPDLKDQKTEFSL